MKGEKDMTLIEKQMAKMTPEARKKANQAISDMMGMPKKKAKKGTAKKK